MLASYSITAISLNLLASNVPKKAFRSGLLSMTTTSSYMPSHTPKKNIVSGAIDMTGEILGLIY